MGVYVKGMEMPHDCGDCDFLSGLICPDNVYHCYAPVDNKNYSIDVTEYVENWLKPLWCPLVKVPTPHGRLIDADEIVKDLRHDVAVDQDMLDCKELTSVIRETTQADKVVKQNAAEIIESTPTVIEGSK
jgi:hypothetical protein